MQDPSGFPGFHDTPPPPGPKPLKTTDGNGFSTAVQLSPKKEGGYRPQVAIGPDDRVHTVFYIRHKKGDLLRYRYSEDNLHFSKPESLGFEEARNWGPDLVVRDNGQVVLVFDRAEKNFNSQGWLTIRAPSSGWSTPEPLTRSGAYEVGSGHIAHGTGNDLAYVYIGKEVGPQSRFTAFGRWRGDQGWSQPVAFTNGRADAWHTNVERRPDGSVLASYDVGPGGSETRLFLFEGRNGQFSDPVDFSKDGQPGERAHFAFGKDGTDHIAWFHKKAGKPLHVYVRNRTQGQWSPVEEPSSGFGGYHFDPDIEVNKDGTLCLVWGWDGGDEAEMVYSLNHGEGWSSPRQLASIGWGKPGLASIQADSKGRFHVVWNQGVKGENHVYYAMLDPNED
ncbi:MAG: hypothetical protein VX519_11520 [Myxococcota bacterium]|nr:hypothetical protein [Myxococcota bacterium]